jgi:hypothetical protein
MAASSLRPIRRTRISSGAALVSKRHPASVFTIGIGSVQPFFPTPRNALSAPAGTIACAFAHASRKFVTSSGSTLAAGM